MPASVETQTQRRRPRPAAAERRNRALDSFVDLLLEGHGPPSPEQVAERTGISMATFFRYFETLDQLRGEAMVRVVRRFSHLFRIPDIGSGTRAQRIERFVATRVELWETIHPVALLMRRNAQRQPGAADMVEFARTSQAKQIRRHFQKELAGFTPSVRDDAVFSMASLTSVESWEQFRNAYDRSPRQIRRAWVRTIDRILRGAR